MAARASLPTTTPNCATSAAPCGCRAPASIAGRIEVRGVGIVSVPHQPSAPLRLVVDLVASSAVERLPEPAWCRFFGYDIPLLALAPFEASAPAKLRLALSALARGTDDADAAQR